MKLCPKTPAQKARCPRGPVRNAETPNFCSKPVALELLFKQAVPQNLYRRKKRLEAASQKHDFPRFLSQKSCVPKLLSKNLCPKTPVQQKTVSPESCSKHSESRSSCSKSCSNTSVQKACVPKLLLKKTVCVKAPAQEETYWREYCQNRCLLQSPSRSRLTIRTGAWRCHKLHRVRIALARCLGMMCRRKANTWRPTI